MKVHKTSYSNIHYIAQCTQCEFESGIDSDTTTTQVVRSVRRHVISTGHKVHLETGSSFTFEPASIIGNQETEYMAHKLPDMIQAKYNGIVVYIHDGAKPKMPHNFGKLVVSKKPNSHNVFCVDSKELILIGNQE